MASTSIILVEDDPEFLGRFKTIIEAEPSFVLVGTAGSVRDAMTLIDKQRADCYLIDLGLPDGDGIDVIRAVAARHPDGDIMVVTVFGDDAHVVASIEAGATGYVLKDSPPAEMVECVKMLRAGGSPVSPVIARRVLQRFRAERPPSVSVSTSLAAQRPAASIPVAAENPLSDRETEILQLLAKGLAFTEIGELLTISPHTVTAHVKRIYRKLAVHSRGEAVFEANQMGLLKNF